MTPSLASRIHAANAVLVADGDLDAVGDFFVPDFVAHLTDRDLTGHDAIRRYVGGLRRAFPDLRVAVDVFVEADDRIAWQRTLRGTHRGDVLGFPASGRELVWRDMVTSRFLDGLIAEDWSITDLAERLLRARRR